MSAFFGEKIKPAPLRFDYSSPTARDDNARRGMRTYGPYDSSVFDRDRINCAVIYAQGSARERDLLVNGLINGDGPFAGFHKLFRIPLEFVSERPLAADSPDEIQRAARLLIGQSPHPELVFLIASKRHEVIYSATKAFLLGNGVPNQVVLVDKLRSADQRPWVLESIALQCYAKIGGTPWTVATPDNRRELVIGVSRAQDRQKNLIIGFVTVFANDGDYLFMQSTSPTPVPINQPDDYRDALTKLIVDAYREYAKARGEPESVILHLCKRAGRLREIDAIQRAMVEIGKKLPYALVHLNDDTNYRLFDTSHRTYVPETYLTAEVSDHSRLLLLDGRLGDERRKRGLPRILEINLDHRSQGFESMDFPRLVSQIVNFSRINWRGFNAQASPATLNYSKLIADLVADIGAPQWNAIIGDGRLADKAWFL